MEARRPDPTNTAHLLAESLLGDLDELTGALVRLIGEENAGYRLIGVVPEEDLRRSCRDNLRRVLQLIGRTSTAPPADDESYDAARETGRRRAVQRLPLDDVLRSFRLGGRLVWQALTERARAARDVDIDALLDLATRVWEVVDAISAQVALAYHAAERALVRVDEQRRAALWEGLLQGRTGDAGFAYEAGRTLRLPPTGPYVAVAAVVSAEATGVEVLTQAFDRFGASSAWQLRGDTLVGVISLPGEDIDGCVKVLRSTLAGPAGVSQLVDGLAAVHIAYRHAVLALRTVAAGRTDIVRLDERLPEALLLSSPDLTDALLHHWLRGLLDLAGEERDLLLQTFSVWVRTGGSATRSAQELHCHRNTVLNRAHRIEGLTGQRLTGVDLPLELGLVVRALPLRP